MRRANAQDLAGLKLARERIKQWQNGNPPFGSGDPCGLATQALDLLIQEAEHHTELIEAYRQAEQEAEGAEPGPWSEQYERRIGAEDRRAPGLRHERRRTQAQASA